MAFPDEKLPPTNELVTAVVGPETYADVGKVITWLETTHTNVVTEWKFSAVSGWYEIPMLKQRRIFYFIPKVGDFRLNLVLGDKAIASLSKGPYAKKVAALVKSAKRYPEGTLFSFNKTTFNPEVFIAMIRAKLAH